MTHINLIFHYNHYDLWATVILFRFFTLEMFWPPLAIQKTVLLKAEFVDTKFFTYFIELANSHSIHTRICICKYTMDENESKLLYFFSQS